MTLITDNNKVLQVVKVTTHRHIPSLDLFVEASKDFCVLSEAWKSLLVSLYFHYIHLFMNTFISTEGDLELLTRLQRDQEFSIPGFPGRDFAKSRDFSGRD